MGARSPSLARSYEGRLGRCRRQGRLHVLAGRSAPRLRNGRHTALEVCPFAPLRIFQHLLPVGQRPLTPLRPVLRDFFRILLMAPDIPSPPLGEKGESGGRWIKLSAVLLALVALIAAAAPFMTHLMHRYNPAGGGVMPLGAAVMFLALCTANALRTRWGKPVFTTPGESLGCFVVLLMGSWAAGWAFTETQMPLLTSPYVFASPENGWSEHVLPHLPRWALGPTQEPYASGFYNGLPTGTPMPWGLWVVPVAAWTAFALTLALFCAGLSSLLSRQWVEHDRLTFPHVEVLLGIAKGFLTDRRFWWGFAIAAVIPMWNSIQPLMPVLPKISLFFGGGGDGVEWFKGAWKIIMQLNIMLLGLFYFVHRDIVLSMCVFFFVLALENYGLNLAGAKLEHTDVLGGGNVMAWQTSGSILMLVLFSLWAGRHTLLAFIRSGIKGEDPGHSWMSPRAALFALVVGLGGLTVWMMALGLKSPLVLLSFLGSQTLGYIGMSRLVIESGLEINWPVDSTKYALLIGGTAALAPAGFVALALSQCWLTGSAHFCMVNYAMQGEKIRSQFKLPRGLLVTALFAVALSTVVAMYTTAWLAYDRGANNFGHWPYQWHMRIPYDQATDSIRGETVGTDPVRLGWLGAGMGLVSILIFLRNHVVGWFLHPVGLILAAMGIPSGAKGNIFVFTGILAWIIKTLILRFGGVESYERLKPLFAGIVVGHFLPDLLAGILDVISFIYVGHRLE